MTKSSKLKASTSDALSQDDDSLALELGHILWYLQTGKDLEGDEELEASWAGEHVKMQGLARSIIEDMFGRGINITYYDRALSHFGKK